MDKDWQANHEARRRKLRIGLQIKSVLILSAIIVAVTAAGGWLYFDAASLALHENDVRHAEWTGQAMSLTAQQDLLEGRNVSLQKLVGDCIANGNILYVALIDSSGSVVASACREGSLDHWRPLTTSAINLARVWQQDESTLVYANPVVSSRPGQGERVVGALRLALDTRTTRRNLIVVQQRIAAVAAVIVILAIPIAYFFVWRILLFPIRHLASVSRRLGSGDMSCRTDLNRNDEMGDLSAALDGMAEEISRNREAMVIANELLEKKVAQRTEELERLNARLREEIAEREDFVRAVSHDLSAPLRNITGMVSMILMRYRGVLPEEAIARLERITANTEIESSMIEDLLELSRIKTRPEKRQVLDMGELIKSVGDAFSYELSARNIELTICRPMPSLYVEKNRMRQIFQNLIDNAIKYMNRRRGGKIEIGYRLADDSHEFYVKDNGPGVPSAEQQKIFYVFRRAQDPNVAKVAGKGVGLAAVKGIVSNYEGKVWVQSDVGQGATFFVTLGCRCTSPPDGALQEDPVDLQQASLLEQ